MSASRATRRRSAPARSGSMKTCAPPPARRAGGSSRPRPPSRRWYDRGALSPAAHRAPPKAERGSRRAATTCSTRQRSDRRAQSRPRQSSAQCARAGGQSLQPPP
eukprot:3467255-Prymnesium_polylepis.2